MQSASLPATRSTATRALTTLWRGMAFFFSGCWNSLSLVVLLSFTAAVPVFQFASLGYILVCAARIAKGDPAKTWFPGMSLAGQIVRCGFWTLLTWLPVWFLTDLGYSSELIQPGSLNASRLRIFARFVSILWVLWVAWAIARGGRWRHFLWPQPIRFVKTILTRSFWLDLENRWWEFLNRLHLWRLIKLGFFASIGALLWLAIPSLLILIGLNGPAQVREEQQGGLALLGLLGALSMAWVIQYLPVLQIHMAVENRFSAIFDRTAARQAFRQVPWTYALAHVLFFAFTLPLYLLRIESIPAELWFLLSVFFVVGMFPGKLLIGWVLRRSRSEGSRRKERPAHWILRWIAWIPLVASIAIYVGFLYLGKFALWEGGASVLFQHAFLPPVPFYIR